MTRLRSRTDTRKSASRARARFGLAVLLSLRPWTLAAQVPGCPDVPSRLSTDSPAAMSEDMRAVAECLAGKIIVPVLANLASDPRIPKEIADLSRRITVQVLAAPAPHTGPNAVSREIGGRPSITIDFS